MTEHGEWEAQGGRMKRHGWPAKAEAAAGIVRAFAGAIPERRSDAE